MKCLGWLRRRRPSEAAQVRADAEAQLEAIRNRTPVVERRGRLFARQPPDRFLERVQRAFGGRT